MHSGELPGQARVQLNVTDRFENDENLYLYYDNTKTGEVEYVSEGHKVIDGKVSFEIKHCSDYILSGEKINTLVKTDLTADTTLQAPQSNIFIYIGVSAVLVAAIAIGFYLKKKNT